MLYSYIRRHLLGCVSHFPSISHLLPVSDDARSARSHHSKCSAIIISFCDAVRQLMITRCGEIIVSPSLLAKSPIAKGDTDAASIAGTHYLGIHFVHEHSPRFPDSLNPHFAVRLAVGAQLILPLVFTPVGYGEAVLQTNCKDTVRKIFRKAIGHFGIECITRLIKSYGK